MTIIPMSLRTFRKSVLLVFLCSPAFCEITKTVLNPFTGKYDFITAITTNTLIPGIGTTITCTNGSCTINAVGGSGGVSSLAVNQNGVQISSPTAAINFIGPPFIATLVGGVTAQITLDGSSVTLQGNNLGATYLTNSSATATYLQISSATATYLQNSSATITYCHANGTNCTSSGGGGGGASTLGVNQNGVQITSPTVAINALGPPFIITSVGGGTTAQFTLDPSSVTLQGQNVIDLTSSLQSGATFYVSSGTVNGPLIANSYSVPQSVGSNTGVIFQNGRTYTNSSTFEWNGTTMSATQILASTGTFTSGLYVPAPFGENVTYGVIAGSMTTGTLSVDGSQAPAASNQDIQYNNNGAFGGNNNFTYDGNVNLMTGGKFIANPGGFSSTLNSNSGDNYIANVNATPGGGQYFFEGILNSADTFTVDPHGVVNSVANYQLNGNRFLWDGGNQSNELFIGRSEGPSSISSASQICIGSSGCGSITNSAAHTTMIGNSAGASLTNGNNNVCMGDFSCNAMTTAQQNTCVGEAACQNVTTSAGGQNTTLGYEAGLRISTGSANICIGDDSCDLLTGGNSNIAIGNTSMGDVTTGNDNVCIGGNNGSLQACSGLITGSSNTAVGNGAGSNASQNANNQGITYLGWGATNATSNQLSNATVIGFNAVVNSSNTMVLGGTGNNAEQVVMSSFTASSGTLSGQFTAGTYQGGGLTTCGDSTHALNWSGGSFGCQSITGTGGGGGGSSSLAVTTGTSAGFSTIASSPTAVLNFDNTQFSAQLEGSATAFVTIPPSAALNISSLTVTGSGLSGSNPVLNANNGTLIVQAQGRVGIGKTPNIAFDVSGQMNDDTSIGSPFFQSSNNLKPAVSITASGANLGLIENRTPNMWDLGYGGSPTSLGTPVLEWDSSPAINILSSATISGANGLNVTYGVVAGSMTANNLASSGNICSSNGALTTSGCANGTLTGNQTITLSGDATGSGATAITVTNAALQSHITTFSSSITVSGPLGENVTYGVIASSVSASSSTIGGQFTAGTYQGGGLATCGDGTHALNWSGGSFGCQTLTGGGGGGTPGGASGNVQINSAGSFAGASDFNVWASSVVISSNNATYTTYLGTTTIQSSMTVSNIGGATMIGALFATQDNGNNYNIFESTGFILSASSTTTGTTLSQFANFAFSIPANESWEFDCNIGVTGATGGAKYGINGPAGATVNAAAFGPLASATAYTSASITALNTATIAFHTAAAATFFQLTGTMTTSSTAGTWVFEREEGTSGDPSTALAGSYCRATRIL